MDVFTISFLGCGVTTAAVCDFRSGKIPNLLTFPMMAAGLVYHTASAGIQGLVFSASGLFFGICILLILYLMGGMGAGDAKLLGAVGSMVGSKGVIIAGVISILVGLVYASVLLIVHQNYVRSLLRRVGITVKTYFSTGQFIAIPPRLDEKQPALRYAVPIALGTIGYVVIKITGSNIIQELVGFQFSI
jgi:prepilin peptidase CpaA